MLGEVLFHLFVFYYSCIIYVSSQSDCVKSTTFINGKHACTGKVVFQDNFDIMSENWKNSIRISNLEEEEFVVYDKNPENFFIRGGILHIQPTLISDQEVTSGTIDLKMCTGQYETPSCNRISTGYNILPPVRSAEIKSKFFNFKYGILEIRAKLPLGDWIVPQIWLEPKNKDYGPLFNSGRIVIAEALGNQHLLNKRGEYIGNKVLNAGIIIGTGKKIYKRFIKFHDQDKEWNNEFHTYTIIWKPDSIQFLVDGLSQPIVEALPQNQLLVSKFNFTGDEVRSTWSTGSPLAPFDKEFYIVLGVMVGGRRNFPEGSTTNYHHKKPWTSNDIKLLLEFWRDRQNWYSTWSTSRSALQVDYIKVTAL